jgi:tetratricopeptide (TPR) repeat protein
MAQKTNSFERFWQELKRRKVFGVVTTYAATAYIIIEVTNNLVEPLSLPAWIAKLVILLLVAGLPIVVILSWVFDFTSQGIKKTESLEELESKEIKIKPVKGRLRASYVLNAILIITVLILAYPKIFKRNTLDKLRSSGERISVAVMPFWNLTNDTAWNVRQDWIQDILINSLSNSEELIIRQSENINNLVENQGIVNYVSISPSVASTIAQKLDANVFIYGSIIREGAKIRVNAQLIDSKTEEILQSFKKDGTAENIIPLIDSLSVMVKDFLIISMLKSGISNEARKITSTFSPKAYRYFVDGRNSLYLFDFNTAKNMFHKALAIDSNFNAAIFYISGAYQELGMYELGKKWCLKAYGNRDSMPLLQKYYANWLYARFFGSPYDEIKYLRQLQEIDDQVPFAYYEVGNGYSNLSQYGKAIPEYERTLEIYDKWDLIPPWIYMYLNLGLAYHKTGQYKKEKNLYKKAEQYFPNNPYLIYRQAVLVLSEGKTNDTNNYIEKYISVRKEESASEASIASSLGEGYSEAGILDKAEEYYRQALSLEPENPVRMNNLAYFLIDRDRNIPEGMELIDKALKWSTDIYYMLHTKGWGLYKQGKYQEALEILQKSWDLRREKAIYDHEAFLHLEAAKKAVSGMKQ